MQERRPLASKIRLFALIARINLSKLQDVAPGYPARYSVCMEPRGLYRERNGWAENEHSARVKYDEHQELDVSERLYRARDYQPPFDELPLVR